MAMSSAFISGIGTSNDAAKYPPNPMIAILKIYASTILSAGLSCQVYLLGRTLVERNIIKSMMSIELSDLQ